MTAFDTLRQIGLLLWKNYTLRKRKKLRIAVEIIWPLFLFIILVWVRTRGLRSFEAQCHFTERPLPSGGVIPFLRAYVCELNNSCSRVPRNSYYDISFLDTNTQATADFFNLTSNPSFIQLVNDSISLATLVSTQRDNATKASRNLTLIKVLKNSGLDYQARLKNASFVLNQSIQNLILQSNPNFNYLYSNYSTTYQDNTVILQAVGANQIPKVLINYVYGADLDQLDSLRATNLVYDANWIRAKQCSASSPNYLLRSSNLVDLNQVLCYNLTDIQLSDLFTIISTEIDFTNTRNEVLIGSVDFNSLSKSVKLFNSVSQFSREISKSANLTTNISSIFDAIINFKPSSICDNGTQLSIFSFLDGIDLNRLSGSLFNQMIDSLSSNTTNSTFLNSTQASFTNSTTNTTANSTNSILINLTQMFKAANNLSKLNDSQCPAKRSDSDLDPSTKLLVSSNTKSCLCQVIYSLLSRISSGLFSQLKPMFLGKILYAPNSTAFNALIKKANSTFASLDNLGNLMISVADLTSQLVTSLNQSSNDYQQLVNQFVNATNLTMFQNLSVNDLIIQLEFVNQLLRFSRNILNCYELNRFIGFKTEKEVVDLGLTLINKEAFWAAVVFQNSTGAQFSSDENKLPKIVNYKIRMNSSQVHDTTFIEDTLYKFSPPNCLGCNKYFLYGFIYIQDMIEKAIVEAKTNLPYDMGISTQMTPYPCYINDRFVTAISRSLPLFMVLAWIYTVSMLVKDIVFEKEKRLKEFMRVMGLTNTTHWLAWFITSLVAMFFVSVLLCIIIKYGKVVQLADVTVLIVFYLCFCIATITQCFLISVFFNKANLAAVVAGIIYFVLYLPYTILVNYSDVMSSGQKLLASLSSTVAFSYGFEVIGAYESLNIGVQWSNFAQSPYNSRNSLSLFVVCLILLFDSFVYMILTLYVENIAPGEYGIAKPWYFIFSPKYWCGNRRFYKESKLREILKDNAYIKKVNNLLKLDSKKKIIQEEEIREGSKQNEKFHAYSIENIDSDTDLVAGIEIEKLHKVYSRGNNHALKGLSVKFFQNEISAFLGHNGAGKSTTMHLLTGLYEPTSGTAKINGLYITESMTKIRKSLGFVPQHNILFPTLTVKEHLWFYARLKGLDKIDTNIEMEKMLDDTGLNPKKNDFSSNLSGGMQRKLSVAIAFVGGSKTVILDEPSAGVDPQGRRSIWDLLFKYRQGRTIIISTHHMDEADVLGDRIAIISNGKLIAHGTSYFLKSRFGRGYYLTFAKKSTNNDETSSKDGSDTSLSPNGSSASSDDSGIKSLNDSTFSNISNSKKVLEQSQKPKLERIKSISSVDYDSNEMEHLEEAQRLNEENLVKTMSDPQDMKIHEFVKSRFTNAFLVENIGTEMTYSISNKVEFTKKYEKYFLELERSLNSLGIDSMGLSDTTLEEIFIRLAKEPKKNSFENNYFCGINLGPFKEKLFKPSKVVKLTEEQLKEYSTYTKLRVNGVMYLILIQLYALLVKRFHRVRRNVKGFFAEIVLPVVFICLALLVAILTPKPADRPPLELHPWYYTQPNQIFLSKSASFEYSKTRYYNSTYAYDTSDSSKQPNINRINRVSDQFFQTASIGTRCVKDYKLILTTVGNKNGKNSQVLECDQNYTRLQDPTVPDEAFQKELLKANYSTTKTSLECDCSNGFANQFASAGGDISYRDIYALKTRDYLYNLTSRNISDWLVKTEFSSQFFKKRFGGYEFQVPLTAKFANNNNNILSNNFVQNLTNLIAIYSSLLNQTGLNVDMNSINSLLGSNPLISNENVKIWYNLKGYSSSVSYLNVLNNVILRAKITQWNEKNGGNNYIEPSEQAIVAFNHPMPFTKTQFIDELERQAVIDLFVAICVIFALSFIPASFLVFLLEERENCSKQLQFVSGVKPYVFWISNFIWDLINYIVPCILCILIFIIFDVKAYMSPQNFPSLVLLMLLYGWACIPLMYPLNYLFKVPSTAFVVSSSMNVFIGTVSTMATTVLENLGRNEPDLLKINDIITPIFIVLFPHYCLGQGFIKMSYLYTVNTAEREFGIYKSYNTLAFENNGRNILAMFVQGCMYFTLNLLIQYRFFVRIKPTKDVDNLNLMRATDEDDDVAAERRRVITHMYETKKNKRKFFFNRDKVANIKFEDEIENKKEDYDYVKLVNLTKVFNKIDWKRLKKKRHVAVNNLCLGINKGECFGLIGVNGAGKTTTFKMITGDIDISAGDVFVGGNSVSKNIEKVHQNIGYCPQFDAIMPLLTAREHLIFFARLRGIPERYVNNVTEWAMNRVGLEVFADRISGDFSGGNKRKLSTAIALVGDPSVICLDEPTSGMDAKARRLLWNDILSLIKENRIVILTSHSMEECEALCTRLVIMVNGQFKCLGSPQHLKRKYGNGYKLAVRLDDENNKETLFEFMRVNFPFAMIQESHKNLFEYILPFETTKLSEIFGKIEKNRENLKLKDYSVSQTTLDQIFVNFAKAQLEDASDTTNEYKPINAYEADDRLTSVSNIVFNNSDLTINNFKSKSEESIRKSNSPIGPKEEFEMNTKRDTEALTTPHEDFNILPTPFTPKDSTDENTQNIRNV